MAARNALQKYLRVNVRPVLPLQNPRVGIGGLSQLLRRRFSDEAKGSVLDKSENDIGMDSLDNVELVMALEEEFGFEIPENEVHKICSMNLAIDFIASHLQAK